MKLKIGMIEMIRHNELTCPNCGATIRIWKGAKGTVKHVARSAICAHMNTQHYGMTPRERSLLADKTFETLRSADE